MLRDSLYNCSYVFSFEKKVNSFLEIDVETNSKHIVVTCIVRVVVEALLGRELNIL